MTNEIDNKRILYIEEPSKKEAYRQRYGKDLTDDEILDDEEYYSLEEEEKKIKEKFEKNKKEKDESNEENNDNDLTDNDNDDDDEDLEIENDDNDNDLTDNNNDNDLTDNDNDDDDEDLEIEIDDDEEEISKEEKDEYSEEIEELEKKIELLSNKIEEIKFPRAESKTDFASGIINATETKKICNLNEDECYDLAEKRKFYNFLKYFGWDGLANRVIANVRDVEDYSLSRKAKLLDSVFIDRIKQDSRNIQEEKGVRKK